jgi:CRP-like cAMP-binding protein
MPIKLRDLKTEARGLARAGQLVPALAAHDHMLASNPLDYDSRRRIPELLLKLGDQTGAIPAFRAVAMHDIRSGHPLPAMAACKVLESLGQPVDDLVGALARSYGHDSRMLAKFAARQAPVDLDAEIEPLDPGAASDAAAVMKRARARALDFSVFVQYPDQFLPIPFFSELPAQLFPSAVRMLRYLRVGDGEMVLREGEPGTAFYFVASGHLRVVARAGTAAKPSVIERGQLHEGALFGEMALVTDQPRTASVQVVVEADLLEVDRAAVAQLCAEVPELTQRLDRFARERLLKNLLATSPLFKPFDHQQQMELVKRFEGHDVAPGTVLIQEGEVGKGLFVVLLGQVEVARTDAGGRHRVLAHLGAGELFGEMSLLDDRPTTATVRATTPTTILFLGRDYFRRLVGALPQLRQYFEELSKQRHKARV